MQQSERLTLGESIIRNRSLFHSMSVGLPASVALPARVADSLPPLPGGEVPEAVMVNDYPQR